MNFKLVVAIVLVVLLLGGGIYESIFVEKTLDGLEKRIDAIIAQGETYDRDSIEEIIKWWKNKTRLLALSVPHVQINEVSFALHELLGTVMAEDYKSSTAVLVKLSGHADSLRETYSFSFWNII